VCAIRDEGEDAGGRQGTKKNSGVSGAEKREKEKERRREKESEKKPSGD
jgi:hypothetical protein